jgi:hypothetical protein
MSSELLIDQENVDEKKVPSSDGASGLNVQDKVQEESKAIWFYFFKDAR